MPKDILMDALEMTGRFMILGISDRAEGVMSFEGDLSQGGTCRSAGRGGEYAPRRSTLVVDFAGMLDC